MAQYLQRLNIASVEEVGEDTNLPHYQQRVNVVEVVDQNGDPWEPVPGPDPWDKLGVVTRTSTSGSTTLGSTLTGVMAEYVGGEPPVAELYQWQRSDTGDGGWTGITNWTDTATQNATGLTYTTVLADDDKYVRFASKAEDAGGEVAYGSGNAIGPMTPATITVSQATKVTNGTFVNVPEAYDFQTVTAVPAAFAGGFGTLTETYRKQIDTGEGWVAQGGWVGTPPSIDVSTLNVGDQLRFQSRAVDSTGQSKTSNSIIVTVGTPTTIGTVTITPANTTTEPAGETTFTVSWDGGVVSPMIVWSIRSGPGQIVSPNNMSSQVVVEATGQPGATIQVQVDVSDPSSSDSPKGTIASLIIQS